jgi:iron complex outermembrane receptor protein
MQKLYNILVLFILSFSCAFAQTGNLKGAVTTADGGPAANVSISIKGTRLGTISNSEGNYLIEKIIPGSYVVKVTLVGLQAIEKKIDVNEGQTMVYDFVLDESSQQLQEVVVTGGNSFKTDQTSPSLRLATPILEAPQNIQVIGRRVLADQQIFDMLEGVTRNVSGATKVEHWDNYARINMRGSQVGAFRNGMNVQMPWGPLAEDMSMVDRIEFVKGPAGFMLANGNPSGFYNVVTKKPTGQTRGEAGMTLGSFDTYRTTLDLDGKLSKDGKLLYRLNLMGQLKGSHRDFDFNNRYSVVPVLKYLIDDKSSVTLEYTHQFSQMNAIGSNYAYSKTGYGDLPKSFSTSEANLAPTNNHDQSILAIFEHKLNDNWRLTAQASYFNYTQEGSSLWPSGFVGVRTDSLQRAVNNWDVLGLSKTGQIFLNGQMKTGTVAHRILGGLDMSSKEFYHDWSQWKLYGDPLDIYNPQHGLTPAPVFDRSKNIRERAVRYTNGYTALYVQDELGFWENKLRLTLAARYTELKVSNPYDGSYSNGKFTPRAGLSYTVNSSTTAYFLYDQSFNENFGTDWQGKSFDPQNGNNMELGLKRGWLNDSWSSTLTFYKITKDNILVADPEHPAAGGNFYNKQGGQHKIQGIEWDIRGQIIKNLDVMVNYAYTDAKISKHTNETAIGKQVEGSSRHVQNTWLSYTIGTGVAQGFGVSVGYQYQAGRSPWFVSEDPQSNLPDYFRLDGGVTYKKDKFAVNLLVNNILNKYLYSGGVYSYGGGFYYWQTEPGTNFRLSVSYKF